MSRNDDNSPALVRIFSDRPVTGAEGLDFQFDGLVCTLAELAWNRDNATPFTAVIRGGWGRGKDYLAMPDRGRAARDAGAGGATPAAGLAPYRHWISRAVGCNVPRS